MTADNQFINTELWLSNLRKRFGIVQKEPASLPLTKEGGCPHCTSQDWRLITLVYADGVTEVDTNTAGEGSSVGIGLGRGRGGIDVNFASYEESTVGHQRTKISQMYAPPKPPEEVKAESMGSLLEKLRRHAEMASASQKPNVQAVKLMKENLLKITLLEFHQKELDLWAKTSVCNRCGTKFLFDKQPSI